MDRQYVERKTKTNIKTNMKISMKMNMKTKIKIKRKINFKKKKNTTVKVKTNYFMG